MHFACKWTYLKIALHKCNMKVYKSVGASEVDT